ncbi:MAG: response regulator transcription factor [Chitinophagaceae bacterium]|nr:MAG: response regulator transcription factor [Chitinophagaceae bacterium]
MFRILIADDHDGVRLAVKNILLDEFDDVFVEECSDTQELISKGTEADWDVVVSDLAMPGGGGFHALKMLRKVKPELPVIIFSTYPPEQYASRVVQAGAIAFISKDAPVTGLVSTLRGVLAPKM